MSNAPLRQTRRLQRWGFLISTVLLAIATALNARDGLAARAVTTGAFTCVAAVIAWRLWRAPRGRP